MTKQSFPVQDVRQRLVAAAYLTPVFLLLELWVLFVSPNMIRADLLQVFLLMLAIAFAASYCITLFVIKIRSIEAAKARQADTKGEHVQAAQ